MKRFLLLLTLAITQASFSQIVNIPDPNFKSYLLSHPGINTNGDTEIQVTEASSYSDSIFAVGLGIFDLTGIQAFTNLTFLSVVNNSLGSLNVTQNTQLKGLICAMNGLSTVNVTQNPLLERLVFAMNQNFMGLDLSNNLNLKELNLDNTAVMNLDVSNQVLLEKLYCSDANLTSLDVSACPNLKTLECISNSIMSLNTTGCAQLENISCQGNMLTNMDLSTNVGMKTLRACCNQMTSLDVSNLVNLEILDSPLNNYTTMDLSNNPNLKTIYLFDNQLTSLNLANGNNTAIDLCWAMNNFTECVTVDNPNYAYTTWVNAGNQFYFDPNAIFSVDCTMGITKNELQELKIFPNPVANSFSVEVDGEASLFLYALDGELILEKKIDPTTAQVDVSSLISGIYLVKLTTQDKPSKVVKLVKL